MKKNLKIRFLKEFWGFPRNFLYKDGTFLSQNIGVNQFFLLHGSFMKKSGGGQILLLFFAYYLLWEN